MIGVGISLSSAASYAKDLGVPVESILQLNSNGMTLGGNLDNSRTSTATVIDHDGVYRTAKVGETRLQGDRRVENLIPYSGDFSNAAWLRAAGGTGAIPTKTPNAGTAPDDTATACRLQLNRGAGNTVNDYAKLKVLIPTTTNGRGSIYVRARTGAYTIGVGTENIRSEITVTTSWQRVTHPVDTLAATQFQIEIRGGASNSSTADLYIWHPEFSDMTGASVTSPPDYIDSRTEYNATTLGVQYLSTTNGNTVTDNIVTAGTGGTIPTTTYFLLEPAATNFFLNSDAPMSQTIALAAGTYTMYVVGSGSITLTGGATGTVTSASVLTFVASGSTTFTVTGSLTKVQVEAGSKATSYISTSSGGVTTVLNEASPVTQTVTLSAGTNVVTVTGAGSVDIYEGYPSVFGLFLFQAFTSAVGSATASAPLSFTSTTGTYTLVVTGTVDTIVWKTGVDSLGATARSADNIFTTATLDSNWYQHNGIFMMKFTPLYSASETSATPLFNSGTLTISPNPTGYTLTDGTNSVSTSISNLVSGTATIVAFAWDADESQLCVNYSNNGGTTWGSWYSVAYDGEFNVPATFEWFKDSVFVNRLHTCRIYKTPNKTLAQAQLWTQANAAAEMT